VIDHPQRTSLHNEIHARPPEPMTPPLAISHVVMLADPAERDASRDHLSALLRDHHLPALDGKTTHSRHTLGGVRVRWEQHTEFVSWTFMRPLDPQAPGVALAQFTQSPLTASAALPQAWLDALPGQRLVALNLWAFPQISELAQGSETLVKHLLHDDTLVASGVAEGRCEAYTDFAIHPDGFSRQLLFVGQAMTPRGLGRLIQQLLEIETYRMAALLGFPLAHQGSAELAAAERELAALATAIPKAEPKDEPQLLDRLTQLAGQIESQYAARHSRFSASAAYFALVDKRINDIAETRIVGMQSFREFMDRRLSPARNTCEWAVRRQDALSQRVSRMSNLLRTRVEIKQQANSEALLAAMNSRQDLQLKLQSTVEGLSVAAITYYIVGLVNFLAKGAQGFGWPLSPETSAAAAIPVVAFSVWWLIRRLHRRLLSPETR
jgi:uncharacterized membrane-anchored protein